MVMLIITDLILWVYFLTKKTLEAIRDIIRETMLGNVAIVLLINISPDYMVQKNCPSIIMLSVFILIICIKLWIPPL